MPFNRFSQQVSPVDWSQPPMQPRHRDSSSHVLDVSPGGVTVMFISPEAINKRDGITVHMRPRTSESHRETYTGLRGKLNIPDGINSPLFHAPPLYSQRRQWSRPRQTSPQLTPSTSRPKSFKRRRSSSESSSSADSVVPSSQTYEEELPLVAHAKQESAAQEPDSGSETEPEDCPGCVRCSDRYKLLHQAVYSQAAAMAAVNTAFTQFVTAAIAII